MSKIYGTSPTPIVIDEIFELAADLDLDIWNLGRDPKLKNIYTTEKLKANYPFIHFQSLAGPYKMIPHLLEQFPAHEYEHRPYYVWEHYIFFQTTDQRDLARALRYIIT